MRFNLLDEIDISVESGPVARLSGPNVSVWNRYMPQNDHVDINAEHNFGPTSPHTVGSGALRINIDPPGISDVRTYRAGSAVKNWSC